MAKVKNKKNSGLADKVHNKRKQDISKKKLNPFEVHINREKLKVLGKKSKHDRGLPGVSRAKAIQKRKETLGTEMKLMNKTNTFIDRRIGEKNSQLSAEDKMVARFAAERAKIHSKKNIYNLADDEILTHRGQTLEQIEKFDDPRSDDEEDDEKRFGGLTDDFVADGHFGGGMLSRTDSKDGAKSHKDLIEQLIAESKKRKAEKQKEKEQTLDLTDKLDSEWKDLQPVVFKRAREEPESAIEKLLSQAEKKGADYDKMMRELKFEKRGTPSDGLKSTEKQAKEEKERLEKLERERIQRMYEDDETPAKKLKEGPKHRSADDLDDNFELEDEKEFMLAYDKDGKPLVPDNILKDYSVPNGKPKFEDGISDTSDEDDEDDGDEEESDGGQLNDEVNTLKDAKNDKDSDSDGESDEDNNVASNVENSIQAKENKRSNQIKTKNETIISSKNIDTTKIKEITNEQVSSDDDSDIDDKKDKSKHETNNKNQKVIIETQGILGSTETDSDENDSNDDASDDNGGEEKDENDVELRLDDDEDDLQDLKESDVESEEGNDYDVDDDISTAMDSNLEGVNIKELLSNKTPGQHSAIIEKLIKKYDPSLAVNNKELLSKLFAQLLYYINDIFKNLNNEGEVIKSFLIFDKIVPYLYDLAHTNKVSTKKYLAELLKEKHDRFKKNPKKIPDLDTLIFFKLVSLIYPTSDFKHPITTPCLIFMMEILTLSRFRDRYSISRGIFVTSLILEFTTLSKRYVPAAINFLRGILYLSANISILSSIQIVPPFKLHQDSKLLNLDNDFSNMEVDVKMTAKDFVLKDLDDDFKTRTLLTTVLLVKEFFQHFNDLDAQECIFEPHIKLLNRVDVDLYPKKVHSAVSDALKYMKETLEVKTLCPLREEKKKPKALRLYEPDVQEVFTGSKSSKLTREKAECDRLQHKYKREMKGALREIRRDKAYIASVKIRQKIHSDNVRKAKVKQIYKEASIQQGELNKIKRMK